MKKLLLIICALNTVIVSQAGGGWTQKKGEGFFFLHERILHGNKFFRGDGEVVDITTTGVYFTTLYSEYGITDRFTGIATTPLFVRSTLNEQQFTSGKFTPGDEVNSFGDFDFGIKYGIIQNKPVVVSVSLIAGLPFGNPKGGETGLIQTGDGEFNQMIRTDVSGGFNNGMFASAYFGFNNRTNSFSDEWHYGFELGFTEDNLLLFFKSNGVLSLFNGDGKSANGGIFSNNVEYQSIALEAGYYLNKEKGLGILGGIQGAFFAKNVLAVPSYHLGIFYERKK